MFASLIFYFMFPPQVHGPPPFSNAVMVYQHVNSWPLTHSFTTTWEGCPDCQAAYELGIREAPVTADFNRDGMVNSQDLYDLLALMYASNTSSP